MLFVKECRAAQNARFCSGGYAMMSKKDRTRQQMEEEMRQLRKVFMTVRLMKADEVQGGKKGSAPCYAQWRRSRPCENWKRTPGKQGWNTLGRSCTRSRPAVCRWMANSVCWS